MNYTNFLEDKANILRLHALHGTTKAESGHPTSSLSCAEIVATLFFKEMSIDPEKIDYLDNDEFILSKGHAVPILYAAFAELGIIDKKLLDSIRKFSSPLEGHPVPRIKGIRVSTGSLGQGLSIGIGMAYAKKILKIDSRVYVLLGDGEMAEGSVWEALNLAGKLRLSNLTAILDMNRLGQSEPTMYGWDSKEYETRIKPFGWTVYACDGHKIEELIDVLQKAKDCDTPSFIIAKTVKGKNVSFLEDAEGWHGKALKNDELKIAEMEINSKLKGIELQPTNLKKANYKVFKKRNDFVFNTNYKIGDMVATRDAYGQALVKLGQMNDEMIVIDGDVKNSTYTESFFSKFTEKSIQCYISEQNMVGVGVGLQTQGFDVFLSTFACFLTRAFDQIRMASYSRANLKITGSHCGVSIGEDGPSQMGLEDIAMFRSIIGSIVLYPADAVSSEKLTNLMANYYGISYLRTSRPKTPVIYGNDEKFFIGGSKILRQSNHDIATIISAGITVYEAIKAHEILRKEGLNIRILDCYSIKPLDIDTIKKAKEETKNLITVEDHYSQGGLGEAVASLGLTPRILSVGKFPHSGKSDELIKEQGIDSNNIINEVRKLILN